jgi:hypothetical protein
MKKTILGADGRSYPLSPDGRYARDARTGIWHDVKAPGGAGGAFFDPPGVGSDTPSQPQEIIAEDPYVRDWRGGVVGSRRGSPPPDAVAAAKATITKAARAALFSGKPSKQALVDLAVAGGEDSDLARELYREHYGFALDLTLSMEDAVELSGGEPDPFLSADELSEVERWLDL